MPRTLLVTRHQGTLDWLRRQGIDGEVVDQLDLNSIRQGDRVIGNLPLHLAAAVIERGARFESVTLDIPK